MYLLRCILLFISVAALGQPAPETLIRASLVADTTAVAAARPFTVGIVLQIAPGWHTYWLNPGESGAAVQVEWELPPGFTAGTIRWPVPHARLDEGKLLTYTYEGELILPVLITPGAQLPAGEAKITGKLRWLACEKTCIPGKSTIEISLPTSGDPQPANTEVFTRARAALPLNTPPPFTVVWDLVKAEAAVLRVEGTPPGSTVEFYPLRPNEDAIPGQPTVADAAGVQVITLPVENGAPNLPWSGLVVMTQGEQRQAWPVAAQPSSAPSTKAPPIRDTRGLGRMLLLAFVGGLILNIMPCVLPVIALKIFGFVQQAGQDPGRVSRLGLAFAGGVFTFFFALALVVIGLKAAGGALNWGFQFQNPFLLAGLIALVFGFALNLLGVFEITLSSDANTKLANLANREGYGGAFVHGLFTTLLGTSCTAPFLSTSLGYAVTQPAPAVILLFLTIAAGMSLPYVLLTAQPAWLKYIPKPGAWMEHAKKVTGFIMLGVAIWLLTVLWTTRPDAGPGMAWFLFALAVAAWIYGTFTRGAITLALALAIVAGGYFALLHGSLAAPLRRAGTPANASKVGILWEEFTEAKVTVAVAAGRPVFIDFTADWCINCKVFERTAIETEAVSKALKEKGVLTLKADYTHEDPAIKAALASFSRIGVPLYVLHRPGEPTPIVSDALTESGFLSDLAAIKPTNAKAR